MIDFAIKDCALVIVATGHRAQTLREMRDICATFIPAASITTSGERLRPGRPQYNNDFAMWCYHNPARLDGG